MTKRLLLVTMLFLLAFSPSGLKAADWQPIVDLRGTWDFIIGDDPEWADPNVNTSSWDQMRVPKNWDKVYPGYNGYAWYRKSFDLNYKDLEKDLVLILGYIDDVDEVFVNGHKVGQTGEFFPNFETAYNVERKYAVSSDILKQKGNVICVRVFDWLREGGIVHGTKFGLFYDRDSELLSLDLSGNWLFSPDYEKGIRKVDFDDRELDEIYVPMTWEQQGYPDLDGFAWYRKRFNLPTELKEKDLYLVLGRIDDMDRVFLNGKLIGETEELKGYSRFRQGEAWRLLRVYRIPRDLLSSKNLIVVEVEDTHDKGGIYEGPIGLVEKAEAEYLTRKYYRDRKRSNGWGVLIEEFINTFD